MRSLLSLKHNVSKRRTRLTFAIPKMEHQLLVRLVANVYKYTAHFGEFPTIYNRTLEVYGGWSGLDWKTYGTHPKIYKDLILSKSIRDAAKFEGVVIGPRYMEVVTKYMYRWPDRRENLVVRWLIKFGFFDSRLFPMSEYCEGENSRRHVTNECPYFRDLRDTTLRKMGTQLGIGNLHNGGDLEELLLPTYFCPPLDWTKKQMRNMVTILKEFASSLYIDRKLKPKQEKPDTYKSKSGSE